MKLHTLYLFLLIISCIACKYNNKKNELFKIQVISENSLHHGFLSLNLNGAGELRNIDFQLVTTLKDSCTINTLRELSKSNQVYEIDITLNAEDKPSWIPFTELTKILNEIKGMAEEYNCKTIVYIHSDRIK